MSIYYVLPLFNLACLGALLPCCAMYSSWLNDLISYVAGCIMYMLHNATIDKEQELWQLKLPCVLTQKVMRSYLQPSCINIFGWCGIARPTHDFLPDSVLYAQVEPKITTA